MVFTRDTRSRDREKSSSQAHLFNISTVRVMDITSGQPQVKNEPITPYFFKHLTTESYDAAPVNFTMEYELLLNRARAMYFYTLYYCVQRTGN
jgi:hypothetical protein